MEEQPEEETLQVLKEKDGIHLEAPAENPFQINQYITPDNVWLKVVGVLALVGLVALVEIRYRFVKRKYIAAAESRVEEMQHAESRESTVERSTGDDPAARQDPDES